MPSSALPYAKCTDCAEEFPDRNTVNSHLDATLAPNLDGNGARGHEVAILNPPPAEREARRIRRAVDDVIGDALDTAIDKLTRLIDTGQVTAEQVEDRLSVYPDFEEAWQDRDA